MSSFARASSSAETPFSIPVNSLSNSRTESAVLSDCAAAATMKGLADLRISKPNRTPDV
jgi:hypothetical protein